MKTALMITSYLICLHAQAQKRGVYTDVATALRQPDKVRVLDLRGQELDSLPKSLNSLQNVEAILIGMRRRRLLFYPPAWKYIFHLKRLPAGGYLHIQGRGGGRFYLFNNFKTVPLRFCKLPKLRVLDIDGGIPFILADTVASQMARCRPQVIVLGGSAPSQEKNPGAKLMLHLRLRREATEYLRQFKLKW